MQNDIPSRGDHNVINKLHQADTPSEIKLLQPVHNDINTRTNIDNQNATILNNMQQANIPPAKLLLQQRVHEHIQHKNEVRQLQYRLQNQEIISDEDSISSSSRSSSSPPSPESSSPPGPAVESCLQPSSSSSTQISQLQQFLPIDKCSYQSLINSPEYEKKYNMQYDDSVIKFNDPYQQKQRKIPTHGLSIIAINNRERTLFGELIVLQEKINELINKYKHTQQEYIITLMDKKMSQEYQAEISEEKKEIQEMKADIMQERKERMKKQSEQIKQDQQQRLAQHRKNNKRRRIQTDSESD